MSFCSAQRVLNATACVHSEIAETKARGGGGEVDEGRKREVEEKQQQVGGGVAPHWTVALASLLECPAGLCLPLARFTSASSSSSSNGNNNFNNSSNNNNKNMYNNDNSKSSKRQQTKFSEAISMKFISHEDLSRFQTALATPANAYKCNLWLSRIMHTSTDKHTHSSTLTHTHRHTVTATQHAVTPVLTPST